jgi:hypothetical protein
MELYNHCPMPSFYANRALPSLFVETKTTVLSNE